MKKILLLIPLFLFLSLALFCYLSLKAPSSDTTKKIFVINQGEGLLTIASRLEKFHFINNRYVFVIYSRVFGLSQKIQAGTFYLTSSETLPNLIQKLIKGGSTDYWFKIIPGTRIEQFSPDDDFTLVSKGLEGQLFPDSYLIPQNYSHSQILALIENNFREKLAEASIGFTTKLTPTQTLILASILEREAKTLSDKKIIAGILMNRLGVGMPLQIDATVQYAKDSLTHPAKYWQPISKSDLSIVSPYNTYKNRGLPPSPICNPGFDSLYAAYHPTDSEYVYYLNDSSGQIHYAKNLTEHNANVAKYLR
ncbi:MAG: Aminodeoxychorismate lyase [Candidatus Shapirobacteria bacterium GW2011_GWE1_38_10]|uniref:Endolytic murein transglycosylase n=1 Tax=Candidatus Shapirobacteria bacterium GW2011_GWE1_38_10 TaxID=1618488 RepID=A0A0G0LBU8_9BACT|nr:MAG: Aminodeoxychorismate lyase [Candidatus Shapirobacteria bacterium GW2011_GWF2_37_20]KKQ50121.1 MAG: Aminodeoxychorismate lyase [Candidatus Shapirobacteria bacterium GW2011_GWE1_38_10]HBP51479.1 endolytic transglycosylase MltG [Candidatus Shapirobacteria bacterium]